MNIVFAIAAGLLSGFITRAIPLPLQGRTRNALSLVAACLVGYILLPGSMAAEGADLARSATIKLRKWQMRPPSQSCLARKYPVSVAGATLYLPAAPVITIRSGKISHHFQFNDEARAICEQSRYARKPVHAENINFDFSIPMRSDFCEATTSRWGQHLCSPESRTADGQFPAIANLYSPAEFDRQHMLASYTYASFTEDRDKANAANHPFEPQQVGVFDRYANGYWVARNGAWKNDAGEPFTLKCQDSSAAGTLNCTTSYRLKSGPQVTYHFSAPANKLEAVARNIERNFHAMIVEIQAP